ncbi:MAG: hypothetical protein ABJA78_16585 [Ferruginibacter sp.]
MRINKKSNLRLVIIFSCFLLINNVSAQDSTLNKTGTESGTLSAKDSAVADAWYFFDDLDSIHTTRFDEFPSKSKKIFEVGNIKGYNTMTYEINAESGDRLIINIIPSGFKAFAVLGFPDGRNLLVDKETSGSIIHIDTMIIQPGNYVLNVCAKKEDKGDGEFYMSQYIAKATAYTMPAETIFADRLSFLEKQGNAAFEFIKLKSGDNLDIDYGYKNSFDLFGTGGEAWINAIPAIYTQQLIRNVSKEKAEKIYNEYLGKLPELLTDAWKQVTAAPSGIEIKKSGWQKCEPDDNCKYFEKAALILSVFEGKYSVMFRYHAADRFM